MTYPRPLNWNRYPHSAPVLKHLADCLAHWLSTYFLCEYYAWPASYSSLHNASKESSQPR